MKSAAAVAASPLIGSTLLSLLGMPPMPALLLSGAGLLLARAIAPPTLRTLTRFQHACLTMLLLLVLGLLVTGEITGVPLDPGPATLLGIGLGISGLVAVELFADRGMAALRALVGKDSR